MMIQMLRDYRARRRLIKGADRLLLGKRVSIHATRFSAANRIGDDSVVIDSQWGRYSYAGPRCIIVKSSIGQFASIAPDVMIGTGGHPVRGAASLHPIFYLARKELSWDLTAEDRISEFAPTKIGNDVWIGAKAIIRDGVTIGDGAVVGAGAVVVTDLEPYGIYAGVPARLIRYRFPDDVIGDLRALAWWDRDMDWLRAHAGAFGDATRLLAASAGRP